ncbi:MAG: hypothetical protein ACRC4V_01960 [Aeromonas veronii]
MNEPAASPVAGSLRKMADDRSSPVPGHFPVQLTPLAGHHRLKKTERFSQPHLAGLNNRTLARLPFIPWLTLYKSAAIVTTWM